MSKGRLKQGRKIRLAIEFSLVFIGFPTIIALPGVHIHPFPMLWLAAGICFFLLWRDPTFDNRRFYRWSSTRREIIPIVLRVLMTASVLIIILLIFDPIRLFNFPRRRFWFWALVMVLYPILSVYPQGITHRGFLLHRYRDLFPDERFLAVAAAFAFSYMHITFHNWVALILTLAGGFLFIRTYRKTESLLVSGLEHALYGDVLFTIGLGHYLYHAAWR